MGIIPSRFDITSSPLSNLRMISDDRSSFKLYYIWLYFIKAIWRFVSNNVGFKYGRMSSMVNLNSQGRIRTKMTLQNVVLIKQVWTNSWWSITSKASTIFIFFIVEICDITRPNLQLLTAVYIQTGKRYLFTNRQLGWSDVQIWINHNALTAQQQCRIARRCHKDDRHWK